MKSDNNSYNRVELYNSQMDDIHDIVLLGHTALPRIVEIIEDEHLKNDASKAIMFSTGNEIIAGSFMSSMFGDIRHSDIDIYFKNKPEADEWCRFNGISPPFKYVHDLCASISINSKIYNLIVGVPFLDAKDLISRFDIRACAIAYSISEDKIFAVDGAIDDCRNKRIVWQPSARSITVRRLIKYINKGFQIDGHQMAMFSELIRLFPNRDQELLGGYG